MSEVRITVNGGFGRDVNPYFFVPVPIFSGETNEENYKWAEFENTVVTLPISNYTEDGEYIAHIIYKINGSTVRYASELLDDLDSPLEMYYHIDKPYIAPIDRYSDGYADKLAEVIELVEVRIKNHSEFIDANIAPKCIMNIGAKCELENLLKELKK